MANIEKPIWSKDGQTLSNVLIKNRAETYNITDTWYDGSPMDDTRIDDDLVYIKYDGEYLVRNMEEGQVLQKDSVDEMRNLSSFEILLLKMGVYRHVQLNGYYEKGDTPEPIDYFLSDTSEEDDGGSVVETSDIKLEHNFNGYYNSLYYGIHSSQSNNTEAINKLCDRVEKDESDVKTILFPEGRNIQSRGGHTVPSNVNVIMDCQLYDTSPNTETTVFMTIGGSSTTTRVHHKLNIQKRYQRESFEEEDKTAVIIKNHRMSTIDLKSIRGFGIGIELRGEGTGTVYNTVTIGRMLNNYKHIKIKGVGGWVSENMFINGSLNSDSTFDDDHKYGVYFESDSFSLTNNKFIGVGFEGTNITAVHSEYAKRSKFFNCRWEVTSIQPVNEMYFAIEDPETSFGNEYMIGSKNPNTPIRIESLSGRPVTQSYIKMVEGNDKYNNKYKLSSGNLTNALIKPSIKSFTTSSPFTIINFSDGEEMTFGYSADPERLEVYPGSITITGQSLCTKMDVKDSKILYVNIDKEDEGSVQRFGIIALDENGDRITSNSQVSGLGNYNSNYGGSFYSTTGDLEYFIGIGAEVKTIKIIIGGTRIRSFSVYSPDISESVSLYSDRKYVSSSSVARTIEVNENYSVEYGDQIICADVSSGSLDINLPNNMFGMKVTIVDISGDSETNSINITGSFYPNHPSSYTIDEDFGNKSFVYHTGEDGRGWVEI